MYNGDMGGSRAVVYVEDEITRSYLSAITKNNIKLIDFEVSGGYKTVLGRLEDDCRCGRTNTFGVVDRDYDRSAKSGWCNDGVKCYYRLPAHEIENYILDFDVVAQFTPNGKGVGETSEHWRDIAKNVANSYLFTIAYNQAVADIQREICANYPGQIKLSTEPAANRTISISGERLLSESKVVDRLEAEEWMKDVPEKAASIANSDSLVLRVKEIVQYYRNLLEGAELAWVLNFPGKEMFRAIATAMQLDAESQLDLAHYVGNVHSERLPDDMSALIEKIVPNENT